MAGTKRPLDSATSPKPKKTKLADDGKKSKTKTEKQLQPTSNLLAEDVDFPRGGGTSFTPLEVKAIRAEAVKEANEELFQVCAGTTIQVDKQVKGKRRKSDAKQKTKAILEKSETIRVEHLNYKRLSVGMKIFGQVASVQPLALIISLPNQLWAHVPITQVSSQLTARLEAMDEDQDMSEDGDSDGEQGEGPSSSSRIPDLSDIFRIGQYVRAMVTALHAPGATDVSGLGRAKGESQKASRRVELTLIPSKVNEAVAKADLKPGFTLFASVKSIEDHGYILDLGVPDVSGFLSFQEAEKTPSDKETKLRVGQLVEVSVSKMMGNGRTCNVSVDPAACNSVALSEVTNVTSLLPGTLVQSLVTAVVPTGLNLQVAGFFEGTVDQFHLPPGLPEKNFKLGQKVKGRILYDIAGTNPPRFALSLARHVVSSDVKRVGDGMKTQPSLPEAYPIGTILESVKVIRVEPERGLIVEVCEGIGAFVHISQISDEHVPVLSSSSGRWKLDSTHRARVTGFYPLDGLVQLSLRPSVLERSFLQVADVEVGAVIKGTVKKLTDSGLFVSISGNVDGVVWPNHYADIILRQPQKRFKPGGSIKCRVLVVHPERQRVVLTAKRTLVESSLPILARIGDAKVGMVTDAVVFKVTDRALHVEFYNNLKGSVPLKEVSETPIAKLTDAFPVGKPVRVRVIFVDAASSKIVASIRQAAPNFKSAVADITGVDIGDTVGGIVAEIHKDNVIVTLQPTEVRALMSLNNLANRRGVSAAQLRVALKVGDKVVDLVVVSRNPEKGFVIVASKPKTKDAMIAKGSLSIDTVKVGQIVGGRVLRHGRSGAIVKLTPTIHGSLHPTDTCDDYESGTPFAAPDSILKAVVIGVQKEKKHLTLSTRPSRLQPESDHAIVDREINDVVDVKVGDTVRGFIKSVAEHGLFVTLGRQVDARVQIKELFDEYVKDWKTRFEANQLVKGRILSVNLEKQQVEMTFRSGEQHKDDQSSVTFADLEKGQKIDGRVKKIEDYGLFIELDGSKLSGLCHKSELSDNSAADVTLALRSFREGDRVKAIILSLDPIKRRISLGLKPSYFADGDFDMDAESTASDVVETFGVVDEDEDSDEEADKDEGPNPEEDSEEWEDQDDADEDEDDEVEIDPGLHSSALGHLAFNSRNRPEDTPPPSLKVAGGFRWGKTAMEQDEENDDGASSSSEDGDEEAQTTKKKKKHRKQIEQDLTADMHTKAPESNSDFERLLLGSPNSSYLWIQYMSFQLQLSEIDKAREIGRRALRTINFREEQEKLNVWIAMLNIENVYGTDDTLETVFKEAARANDSKTIHLRLATILEQSGKLDRAEDQFKRTCKKFGQSSKVWTLFGEHYLKRGQLEEARKLLPRSLQSLDKRKHLKTISKFAQLEYKLGDPERGRTIFEGIVDSHPKRWDLWIIYIDMEAAQGAIQNARNIFDRVFALKMTSHKAKSLFKKWLELEKRLGDEEGADAVKQKAIEWTRKATADS
ncbi:hypothetical protein JAAARDRAFT_694923 [Jaapia argillacea MUCL 33604]|uniref:S1 motif domain-containing protein n=1 Tax=Jaapia argillacea MUCL 33604 TaxID=933084 RepID=A0A067Q8H7_9AGAM|nr:hypothetical protein JAAARDRAFT_694923 [Jaapia argillacea MUCL 33604]